MRRLISLIITPLFSVYILGYAVGGALFKSLFLRSGAPPREELEAMKQVCSGTPFARHQG